MLCEARQFGRRLRLERKRSAYKAGSVTRGRLGFRVTARSAKDLLFAPLGYVPPVECESAYYRQLAISVCAYTEG